MTTTTSMAALQALHFHHHFPWNSPVLSSQLSYTPCSVSSSCSTTTTTSSSPFSLSISGEQLHHPLIQSPGIINPSSNDLNALFSISSLLCPSFAYANAYFFQPGNFNVQIVVADDEPEDKLISRFRKEVFKAGVFRECKRRRFFETNQEKRKRKTREAARRYRKRRPQAKEVSKEFERVVKKDGYQSEEDYWEFHDN